MRVTSALTAIVAALVVPGCKASGPSSAPPVTAPAPSDAIVGLKFWRDSWSDGVKKSTPSASIETTRSTFVTLLSGLSIECTW